MRLVLTSTLLALALSAASFWYMPASQAAEQTSVPAIQVAAQAAEQWDQPAHAGFGFNLLVLSLALAATGLVVLAGINTRRPRRARRSIHQH